MTTELLHGGISLSDLLHRPSDSESKGIRAKTGALAVSGTTLARGKGPLTSPQPATRKGKGTPHLWFPLAGSRKMPAPLEFTEFELSVSSSSVPSSCFHAAVRWWGPQMLHPTDKAIKA